MNDQSIQNKDMPTFGMTTKHMFQNQLHIGFNNVIEICAIMKSY